MVVDIALISVLQTSCTSTKPRAAHTTSSQTCAGNATHVLRPARVIRDEEKGVIAWRIKSRNGETDLNLLAPITTKPWGKHIPKLAEAPEPSQEMRDSQLLYSEPKYIRMDDGDIHTLKSNGLKMKAGVAY